MIWRDWAVTGLFIALGCAAIIAGGLALAPRYPTAYVLLLVGSVLALLVTWHARSFGYRCPKCGEEFGISVFADFISPHMLTTKYLKCPRCGKRSWAEVLARE